MCKVQVGKVIQNRQSVPEQAPQPAHHIGNRVDKNSKISSNIVKAVLYCIITIARYAKPFAK